MKSPITDRTRKKIQKFIENERNHKPNPSGNDNPRASARNGK